MRKSILILTLLATLTINSVAQIGIHPQVVFLDIESRSSNLLVMNTTDVEKEIVIDLKFGYPGYDSLGNSYFFMGDTLPEAKFSAVQLVKVFPKKLLLNGKEEQVVRFMLGNISDLPDGTFYGRVFITSKNPPREIDTSYTDKITAQVDVHFTLVSALIIQKGKRNCRLSINDASIRTDTSNVNFVVNFDRQGNSPFFGTAKIRVTDPDGEEIVDKTELTPIYFSSTKAFKFDRSEFTNGKYRFDIEMSNEHKDVPDNFKTPIEPVEKTFFLNINLD